MPEECVMFEALDGNVDRECAICHANLATLKCTGEMQGECCLPCACKMLAELAQRTVNNVARQ